MPENKTQSGIKSRSSKEGNAENFNELRFEDKKGEEEIYLHAKHDSTTFVENDENRTTVSTRSTYVGDKENKRPSETIEDLVVQGKRLITIYGDDGLTVLKGENGRKVDIEDGHYDLLVQKGNFIRTIKEGKSTTKVSKNITTKSEQGDIRTEAKMGEISLKAMKQITLTVGDNSIKIDQAGITISGMQVKIDRKTTVDIGSMMTMVKGDGVLTLKGGLTKIN